MQQDRLVSAFHDGIDDIDFVQDLSSVGDVEKGLLAMTLDQAWTLSRRLCSERPERTIRQREDRMMRRSLEQP